MDRGGGRQRLCHKLDLIPERFRTVAVIATRLGPTLFATFAVSTISSSCEQLPEQDPSRRPALFVPLRWIFFVANVNRSALMPARLL